MRDCLFCKMMNGEIPNTPIYTDAEVFAIKDIDPKAPQHFLVIPKRHIDTLNALTPNDEKLIGHMHWVASQLAKTHHFDASGYRVLFNCNQDGGQAVYHIHLHVLGGRQMAWPPG